MGTALRVVCRRVTGRREAHDKSFLAGRLTRNLAVHQLQRDVVCDLRSTNAHVVLIDRSSFADLTLRVFDRSSHTPQLEESDVFDAELLRWLDGAR